MQNTLKLLGPRKQTSRLLDASPWGQQCDNPGVRYADDPDWMTSWHLEPSVYPASVRPDACTEQADRVAYYAPRFINQSKPQTIVGNLLQRPAQPRLTLYGRSGTLPGILGEVVTSYELSNDVNSP